tara:strand:- start:601 stop:1626 length:1026 start_codon:yes stop_codon:yes gene_type:complete
MAETTYTQTAGMDGDTTTDNVTELAQQAVASAASTAADLILTDADTVATAADRVATGVDRSAVAADLVQTNQDTIDTAADLASIAGSEAATAADAVATAADRVITTQDALDTAADVVLTNADVVTAEAAAASAANSATSASASETNASNSATAAANSASSLTVDAASVTAAGALMDSEVANLAAVKAFSAADYASAAQGATADTALQSGSIGTTVQAFDADTLKADTTDNLTAAFTASVDDDGTKTSGTYTPTTAAGSNYKKIINGGAITVAPPALATNTATTLSLFIVNNASAGAITTSGFTKVTGDDFTTTNGHEFMCRIEVFDIGGTEFSTLSVVAMQ